MQIVLQLVNEVASRPQSWPRSYKHTSPLHVILQREVKVNLQSINLLCLSSLFITNVTFSYLPTFFDNKPAFLHLVQAMHFALQM